MSAPTSETAVAPDAEIAEAAEGGSLLEAEVAEALVSQSVGEAEKKRDSKGSAPPPPEVIAPPDESLEITGKSRRKSMFEDVPGNKGQPAAGLAADNLANDLAGTLQTFFSQDEKTGDSSALKPLRRPKLIYDNSYRLSAFNPFNRDRVQKVVDATLDEMMVGVKYNSETANDIARQIAEKIRSRIMILRFDRYKIVVMTNVGPLNRQGLHIGFRFLWDVEKDGYVIQNYKNPNCFCSAVVYGIYFE